MTASRCAVMVVAMLLLVGYVCAQSARRPAGQAKRNSSSVVSVDAHVEEWIKGYTKWSTSHPELLFGAGTPSNEAAKASGRTDDSSLRIDLRWPFMSYFGSDGNLIYAGMESESNLAFLQSLQKSGPIQKGKPLYPPQPPLGAYFDFFPGLNAQKALLLSRKHPVLLTICKVTAKACKQQNEAIAEFKNRLPALRTELVEITIIPSGKK